MIDEMRQQYPAHSARVSSGPLPEVAADGSLLRQVFVNLLSNAFKFTTGTERARIEIGCEAMNEKQVLFVRDNGPGFDMTQANSLFQAFQRLHRSDQFDGNGVGLTIVQRIVQRHGGRVWVDAAPQRGACFYFTLAPQA